MKTFSLSLMSKKIIRIFIQIIYTQWFCTFNPHSSNYAKIANFLFHKCAQEWNWSLKKLGMKKFTWNHRFSMNYIHHVVQMVQLLCDFCILLVKIVASESRLSSVIGKFLKLQKTKKNPQIVAFARRVGAVQLHVLLVNGHVQSGELQLLAVHVAQLLQLLIGY